MKKASRKKISFFIVASLSLLIGCNNGGAGDDSSITYAIGDTGPAGGLIFYIDEADAFDWTYLEVAPKSTEGISKVWGGYTYSQTGAWGVKAIGTGKQNTLDIVDQFGDAEPYQNISDYAAKFCSDLVFGDYDDWFLPSLDELDALWDNLVDNGNGANSGIGGFASGSYWSSSEYTTAHAWFLAFNNGTYGYEMINNSVGHHVLV